MKALWILLALLITAEANGQGAGVAYYAMPGFNSKQCADALRVFRGVRKPLLSTLWGSFGDSNSCLDSYLLAVRGKQAEVLIHSTNETCKHKPRKCTHWDQPNFRARITEIAAYIQSRQQSGVRWFVSLGLEDDFTKARAAARLKVARDVLPRGVSIVRNTDEGSGDFSGVDFVELHRMRDGCPKQGRCVFNNDGTDLSLRESRGLPRAVDASEMFTFIRRNRNRYSRFFLWWSAAQGNVVGKWRYPRQRHFRIHRRDILLINSFLRSLNQ